MNVGIFFESIFKLKWIMNLSKLEPECYFFMSVLCKIILLKKVSSHLERKCLLSKKKIDTLNNILNIFFTMYYSSVIYMKNVVEKFL